MKCPYCLQSDTKVIDSRLLDEDNSVKRRRRCELCEKRFTTFEKVFLEMPFVLKRDGRREKFSREKVLQSIQKAVQKRAIGTNLIEETVHDIERVILESCDREVSSQKIGLEVMNRLQNIDPVAYVRFASVYKTFKDVDEFVKDIKQSGPYA